MNASELETKTVLVVMECASEWPAHIKGGGADCVALGQEANESHGELLRRTYDRIRSIQRVGGVVENAVGECQRSCRLFQSAMVRASAPAMVS